MGSPKSFKDLHKNVKKIPISGKVVKTHNQNKIIRSDKEIEEEKVLQKEMIKFCNTLRCVVCDGQLDGPVYANEARLYCVYDNHHYNARFNKEKKITYSIATYEFDHFEYEHIINRNSYNKNFSYSNHLYKLDRDLIPKFRQKEKVLICSYEGDYNFEFPKNLTEEEFVYKIKFYMTFS